MFEHIIKILLKSNKVSYLEYLHRFFPQALRRYSQKENLWHLGCAYQSMDLLYYAHLFQQDINQFDYRGLQPIHSFIESAFYQKDKKIVFKIDEKFLDYFLSFKPEINTAWRRDGSRDEFMRNILGTPIEVLVRLFWNTMLPLTRDDHLDYYPAYKNLFLRLCSEGANVNFLYEGEDFGKDDIQRDAMQKQSDRIISHYFCKRIANTRGIYALFPFFLNPSTDFSVVDENGQNLIHTLFGRINTKKHNLDYDITSSLIISLLENPGFKEEDILKRDNFKVRPIDLFKKGKEEYKALVNSFLLQEKLSHALEEKVEIKKVKKI